MSGKVQSVGQDNFVLDYGKGTIQVDMDDAQRDAQAYKLASGDKVTVSGRIDDDFFDRSSIDAHSVSIDSQNTTFFADQPMGMQTGRTSDSIYYGGALDMREDYDIFEGREVVANSVRKLRFSEDS